MPEFIKKNSLHFFGYPFAALVFYAGGLVQSQAIMAADIKDIKAQVAAIKSVQDKYVPLRDEQIKQINERLQRGGL